MLEKIYKKIEEFDTIVLARHIGADPDALGSTMGLKDIILENFPNKKVYSTGVYSSKFKYMGKTDDVSDVDKSKALLIVLDVPNIVRIDGASDIENYKYIIKIDHHPEIDKFGDIKWIDTSASSVCQLIIKFAFEMNLKITKEAAEKLFLGVVADTNRFLYDYTSSETFELISRLLKETNINITNLYQELYARDLMEVRFQGYIEENMIVTENGLGYLIIDKDTVKKYGDDVGLSGNVINNFGNIKEVLVWSLFTYDEKNKLIRVNTRSRGPVISTILEKYGGGGHSMASGARIKDEENIEKIIKDLDDLCKEYKKELDN